MNYQLLTQGYGDSSKSERVGLRAITSYGSLCSWFMATWACAEVADVKNTLLFGFFASRATLGFFHNASREFVHGAHVRVGDGG